MSRRPTFSLTMALALLSSLSGANALADDAPVTLHRLNSEKLLEVYARGEWRVDLGGEVYNNPFDPTEVAVDGVFKHTASGRQIKLPAFWTNDFTGDASAEKNGSSSRPAFFKLRFAPALAGAWTMTAVVRDRSGSRQSQATAIEVIASKRDGFIRRAPGSPYLRFDSGKAYFLLGPNIAWSGDGGLGAYDVMFAKLHAGGGNFARVWLAHPHRPMETVAAGLGRYDLDACTYYDQMFELAEKHGIHLMATFMNHRDLLDRDMWGTAQWPNQPYNAKNGGPCTQPSDFITRSDMRELFKRRMRYMVGRYSAYTSLAFWEFWNEQSFTNVDIPAEWTLEMAQTLRDADPYAHLITTSFGRGEHDEVWRAESIDLTQHHYYGGWGVNDCSPALALFHREHAKFAKPSLMAELGIGWDGSDDKGDPTGIGTNLHNGIWASLASGGVGGASNWWWDNYIEKHNLWNVYQGAAKFAAEISWTKRNFAPIDLPPVIDPTADAKELSDLQISLVGGWGKSHGLPIRVLPNGRTSNEFPTYVYGHEQASLRTPTVFEVELAAAGKLLIDVAMVSDSGILRVLVDGTPAADWFFSALPGSADQEETKPLEGMKNVYQAKINKRRTLDLPAGKHTIELKNLGTDWVSLSGLTIAGGRSKRFANAEALAIQDSTSGETIIWLHDLNSNWKTDQSLAGRAADSMGSLELHVPTKHGGEHRVEWWDTRRGEVVSTVKVAPVDGVLTLRSPEFRRDVAVRIIASRASAGGG